MTAVACTCGGPRAACCGGPPVHRIDCLTEAVTQPHAMVNDDGDVFYPDNPEDAEWLAEQQGARFLIPYQFTDVGETS